MSYVGGRNRIIHNWFSVDVVFYMQTTSIGQPPISVFAFAERKDGRFIVHIMHIDSSKSSPNGGMTPPGTSSPTPTSFKVAGQFSFPDDSSQDFPIFMHVRGVE